ncbi:SRPBCC family protein [Ulvibacter antarcticus]|uniref:Polyketide cyclase/dehydrase/lipid transport protein n=1 Tax=Ulvibacter antarcticus TaxID=442714 RepID=A0A3L9Z014_9FLAO|nr:SRPBCC family protein [Ulvibacter antarcticus]RMA66301.1 hypothetical protein BXY75_0722 [Ulvibacter antarcticus]
MKFKGLIDIDQPREKVVALFKDPKYLGEYQEGFIRKEYINGLKGENGAVSKVFYKHGKGEMELTETIISNNLPESFYASYQHKHMDNTLKSTFTSLSPTKTRYETQGEYTAFRGFIPKMLGLFFPKMFEKQAQKWLNNFKVFAEKQ